MKYIIILLALLMTSCASNIPLEKEFKRIKAKKYILHKYDCSNKSSEYYDALKNAGYKPKMVVTYYYGIVFVDGNIYKTLQPHYGHALVYCNGLFLDPTTGKVFKSLAWVQYMTKANVIIMYTDDDYKEIKKRKPEEWDY